MNFMIMPPAHSQPESVIKTWISKVALRLNQLRPNVDDLVSACWVLVLDLQRLNQNTAVNVDKPFSEFGKATTESPVEERADRDDGIGEKATIERSASSGPSVG
ncbi:hypothetical protein HBH56_232670 [Parastagonospora nodorum]|uniref:Uncharacterized protein n=1 Tax=Phaeosphaeria nodorum (strain SN15 / ATCC MYA-4574 / FGSC 10173) TaxID=321614 RepID=A0A7U2ID86_PHANO|nr:hypothetical protein HBH56_232670 [Parastagonospora nodorum]QRD07717.1 hypothetical protein JI435_448120 [Parastagonospora nodorum SN15]KAH3921423.1 hypothetical protein HBH54_240400 [Parastagonospora nodorum]KAH4125393.1 hypothetical protein HBH45_231510 [Parastagonospora nodorum]KAH4147772.1 hypothetical protein HBH44_219740 [Parastagonospora nodorum]